MVLLWLDEIFCGSLLRKIKLRNLQLHRPYFLLLLQKCMGNVEAALHAFYNSALGAEWSALRSGCFISSEIPDGRRVCGLRSRCRLNVGEESDIFALLPWIEPGTCFSIDALELLCVKLRLPDVSVLPLCYQKIRRSCNRCVTLNWKQYNWLTFCYFFLLNGNYMVYHSENPQACYTFPGVCIFGVGTDS